MAHSFQCRLALTAWLFLLSSVALPATNSPLTAIHEASSANVCTSEARTPKKSSSPIVYLDLRPLLHKDYSDSLALLDVWDELHAVSTLQGIVNRHSPRLYIEYVETDGRSIDGHWWNYYRQEGQWLHGRDTLRLANVEEAVRYFQNDLMGAVVYDSNIASTSNVASSIAGMENLLALRYDTRPTSLYSRLTAEQPTLPVRRWLVNGDGSPLFTGSGIIPNTGRASTGSAKCDPYIWFIEHYMKTNRSDGRYAGYYIDQTWRQKAKNGPTNHHTLTNHDFFVARRAFFFDLSPWEDEATDDASQPVGTDYRTLCELLQEAHRLRHDKAPGYVGGFPAWAYKYTQHVGGSHQDVATEWHFAELISRYCTFKDADAIGYGAMANASFWQHFPLKKRYTQPKHDVRPKDLRRRGFLQPDGKVNATKNYVVIYVGDYDAASWLTQRVPSLWDSPERGQQPMMWSISPVLAERAPMVMHYVRSTATANDYFAAADNGAGYLMPGVVEQEGTANDMDTWASHCRRYYRRWGLTVTGFVIDGNGPAMGSRALDAYRTFSPDGIVPQRCMPLSLHKGMPVLQSDFDLVDNDPRAAAQVLVERVHQRDIPFHWFRCILKSPSWYNQLIEEAQRLDPTIQLLDAPTFFELAKRYAKEQ